MKVKYALDVNIMLLKCEEIANKYIAGDELFRFIPGYRYPINGLPINKRSKLDELDKNIISKTPYLPYKCIPCVNTLLLWQCYEDTILDQSLFKINPISSKKELNYLKLYMLNMDSNEIIRHYIEEISDSDTIVFENEVMNIYEQSGLKRLITPYTDHVFELNSDDRLFVLSVLGHIKEIRYEELLNNKL